MISASGELPKQIELTIVMPCLNEAETLAQCLRKAQGFLRASGVAGEIVVGDNGSTDGSQSIAESEGARVINVPLRGYGAALYYACLASRGKYIIMGDSDDSYDFSDLNGFLTRLRAGDDLVMGNRFRGGIKPGAMPWKNRYIGNPVLSGIGKLLFRSSAGDFHCGIRGFSRTAFDRMDLRTTGMEFASEMVIKATLMGLRISEVPTTLSPDGRSRPPHLRPWRDGWRHLRFMLLFSPDWLFLYPGLAVMSVCLVVGTLLTLGPVYIGGVRLDIDSLIYLAFFTIIGFQAVLFSFLSRVHATQEGLYPRGAGFAGLMKVVTLERGLVVGILISFGGVALGLYSLIEWQHHGFGLMDFSRLARLVIPAATALTIGIETILFSLFFSTLQLSVRSMNPPAGEFERERPVAGAHR